MIEVEAILKVGACVGQKAIDKLFFIVRTNTETEYAFPSKIGRSNEFCNLHRYFSLINHSSKPFL